MSSLILKNAVAYIYLYGSDPKRDPNHSLFINPIDPHRMRLILRQPQPGPQGSVGRDESSWDDLRNSSGRDEDEIHFKLWGRGQHYQFASFFKACKILNLIRLSAWLSLDTLGLLILFSVTFVPKATIRYDSYHMNNISITIYFCVKYLSSTSAIKSNSTFQIIAFTCTAIN